MIFRPNYEQAILEGLSEYPVTALLGPRQCGKTTLARMVCRDRPHDYFDLEDPTDSARLSSPMLALENAQGVVVLDEIPRNPHLLELIRKFGKLFFLPDVSRGGLNW